VGETRSASIHAHLSELERKDAMFAAKLERVAAVAGRAEAVRARAAEVVALLEAMPEERLRLGEARRAALGRLAAAQEELEAAEHRVSEVEGSRRAGEQQEAEARRAAETARDAVAVVEAHLGRIGEREVALDEDEPMLRAEGDELVAAAVAIADDIRLVDGVSESGRADPGRSLAGLDEWGARAHAALFVVRGTLEAQRDRVVGEANGLAASVLVEPLVAVSVADVRRRIDAALR
jgi:hypothetical protein